MITSELYAEQQINELHEQSREAALKSDIKAMDGIFSDDWQGVNPLGCVASKAMMLKRFETGDLRTETIDVISRETTVYGNAAVTRGLYQVKTSIGGRPTDHSVRRTDLLATFGDVWKIVATHVTRVVEAGERP